MLGDYIKRALSRIGVTEERVARIFKVDSCGCESRRQKLNALHAWARRVLRGKVRGAEKFLDDILGENDADQTDNRDRG